MSEQGTSCSGGPKLIFACSGCADVGEVADRAARQMTKDAIGKMFCLAGIGGRVPGIMKTTESASKILAIDGCELDCVKKCLDLAGFDSFTQIRVTDLGMVKGRTRVDDQAVGAVVEAASGVLA